MTIAAARARSRRGGRGADVVRPRAELGARAADVGERAQPTGTNSSQAVSMTLTASKRKGV